jgi:hypothetical protein
MGWQLWQGFAGLVAAAAAKEDPMAQPAVQALEWHTCPPGQALGMIPSTAVQSAGALLGSQVWQPLLGFEIPAGWKTPEIMHPDRHAPPEQNIVPAVEHEVPTA